MVNPLLNSLPANNQELRSQARLEETLQPRHQPPPSPRPVVPYYTGLILLSVFTFLFLLFLLFKKQIKEVRFATFVTVLLGVGLPILAIIELTTDLVLREEAPPTSLRPEDPPSQQPAPERETETDPPETAVEEIPLDVPSPANGSPVTPPSPGETTGDDPSETDLTREDLTLSMTGFPRSTPTASPQQQDSAPAPDRSPSSAPVRPTQPSPLAPLTHFSQTLPRITPRPSFSLAHLDFSQPIRFKQILRLNSQGLDVLALQKLLQDLDFYTGSLDGYLGRQTQGAIAQFQATHALLPDGIFGLSTCEILNTQTPDVTIICQIADLGVDPPQ